MSGKRKGAAGGRIASFGSSTVTLRESSIPSGRGAGSLAPAGPLSCARATNPAEQRSTTIRTPQTKTNLWRPLLSFASVCEADFLSSRIARTLASFFGPLGLIRHTVRVIAYSLTYDLRISDAGWELTGSRRMSHILRQQVTAALQGTPFLGPRYASPR